MSKLYPSIMENIVLPVYDLTRRTSRFEFGRILCRSQWLPKEELERLQNRHLRAILKHAYANVPYYRHVFKERGLTPDDVRTVKDLAKLPVLTKADIRKHSGELISRNYPKKYLVRRSSGGTGDQIWFNVTREQISWEVSAEFRAYGWAGYRLGDRCLMFWGSQLDLAKHESLIKKITSRLERILVLNTYVLSNEVLDKYVFLMVQFRPEVVRGYASSVYLVASHLLKKGITSIRPRVVLTSGETLLDFQRKTIETAFSCPVFDYYGSREIGAIAAECEEHNGYHISAENVVLEYIKDGERASPGENGVILVTNLRNLGMPFIRYAIGDVGKSSNENCSCGRGLPLMASVEGRVSQFMAVYDKQLKRVIPISTAAPGLFSMTLMQVPLETYRIIQESLDRVVIRAVKGEGYSQKHTDFIVKHLRSILGDNIVIEFEFVNYLQPLPSGKRSVFTSKIDSFKQ